MQRKLLKSDLISAVNSAHVVYEDVQTIKTLERHERLKRRSKDKRKLMR